MDTDALTTMRQRDSQAVDIIQKVAAELGGTYYPRSGAGPIFEIRPEVFIWASSVSYGPNKGKLSWSAFYPHYRYQTTETIYTSRTRSIAAIAADVKRRVVPVAIDYCTEARKAFLKSEARRQFAEMRRSQLVEILGPLTERNDKLYGLGYGFKIDASDHALAPDETYSHARFRAEIEVRDWNCFLMVARLLKADSQVKPKI